MSFKTWLFSLSLAVSGVFVNQANADQLYKLQEGKWTPIKNTGAERLKGGTYYLDVTDEGVNAYVITAATMINGTNASFQIAFTREQLDDRNNLTGYFSADNRAFTDGRHTEVSIRSAYFVTKKGQGRYITIGGTDSYFTLVQVPGSLLVNN